MVGDDPACFVVLCCAVLCYAVLCCAMLCCIVAQMASGKASASAKHKPVGSSRSAHRTSFRQPVAATDKKDAGDFFKNLLEGKSAKK